MKVCHIQAFMGKQKSRRKGSDQAVRAFWLLLIIIRVCQGRFRFGKRSFCFRRRGGGVIGKVIIGDRFTVQGGLNTASKFVAIDACENGGGYVTFTYSVFFNHINTEDILPVNRKNVKKRPCPGAEAVEWFSGFSSFCGTPGRSDPRYGGRPGKNSSGFCSRSARRSLPEKARNSAEAALPG